jgi:hypothetical protein
MVEDARLAAKTDTDVLDIARRGRQERKTAHSIPGFMDLAVSE